MELCVKHFELCVYILCAVVVKIFDVVVIYLVSTKTLTKMTAMKAMLIETAYLQ